MTTFRWLHLSDFHLGMNHHRDLWPNMEAVFFDDLNILLKSNGSLDLVLFTGDLVQKGDASEYQRLDEWLQKMWDLFSQLKLAPLLLAVPGNHDLVRPSASTPVSIAFRRSWDQKEVREAFWDDNESDYRKLVDQAFHNYLAWWRAAKFPKPEQLIHGLLPGDFSASIVKDSYSLAIIGLNSAFRHIGDQNAEKDLSLDIRQLNAVCNSHPPDWFRQHQACLLMTHHPVSWLSDEAQVHFESEIHSPPERFAVHLFGHMHENNQTSLGKGGGSPRRHLQSASLFGLETFGKDLHKRSHGYSLGELTIENGKATICFKPRKAERISDGSWRFGRDNNFKLKENSGTTFPEEITLSGLEPVGVASDLQAAKPVIDHSPPTKVTYDPHNRAFLVPFRAKGEYMVGRMEALYKVRRQLVSGKPTNIGQTAVFQGIGGLGKTQLAVEYAYHYKDSYPNGVYWLTADENIDAQLTRIAVEARWMAPESEHAIKLALARHRLKSYSDCLIVFDNLESIDAIQDYLPDPSATPHILVTSRREQPDFADVKLDLLDEEQSYQLLVQEARAVPTDVMEESAARDIAVALNGLPMALELAGAYLSRRFIGWTAYRSLLNANLRQALPPRLSSLTKHDADLFKTLSISESDIRDEPLLSEVLDLLTWGGSSPMGLNLMAHLIDLPPTQLYGALGLGEALRLLQKTPDGERYSIHRLVKEVRRQDRPVEHREEWVLNVAERMAGWFEEIRTDFLRLPTYEAEFEHLSAWRTHTELFSSLASTRLLWLQAYPAYHRGRYQEAFGIIQQAIKTYEEQKLDDRILKSNLLSDLASASSFANGVTHDYLRIAEEALAIRRELLGEKHPDVAKSLGALAYYYSELGNSDEALKFTEQSLTMRRELFGEKHVEVALSLSSLASRYSERGDHAEALEFCEKALIMRRELLGEKHPDIAASLHNFALYYSYLGNNARAFELGEQALMMQCELVGEKHPDVATGLSNLASYYFKLGRNDRAIEFGEQAFTMRCELLGEKHPDVAMSLNNLAGYYSKLGNNSRALDLWERALVIRCELLGYSHPLSINSLLVVTKRLCANPYHAKRGKEWVEEFLRHIPHGHPRRNDLHKVLNSRGGFQKAGTPKVSKTRKKRR